jgi:hypothetical protein
MAATSHKAQAMAEAIRRATEQLQQRDIPDEALCVPLFSRNVQLDARTFCATDTRTGEPAHPADHLLVLHYLLKAPAPKPARQWATYRQFPGGEVYFKPFESRTTGPLVDAIGDSLPTLAERLAAFCPRPLGLGDLGVAVQAIGPFELGLVYHLRDEELPASAEILFDANLRHMYQAENAAALASRLCLPLTQTPCPTCSGCTLCDNPTPYLKPTP